MTDPIRLAFTVRIAAAAGLMFLLGGCSLLQPPPEWVELGAAEAYPRERYVSALGTGPTLADAQLAAKAELTRIFSTDLVSEIRLIDEEFKEGGSAWQRSQLTSEIEITTDANLEGLEAPLFWQEPDSGTFWSLAVLDRNRECVRIRAEGRDLVRRLAGTRETLQAGLASRPAEQSLRGLQLRRLALSYGRALDALEGRSRVLGMGCVPVRPISTAALFREEAETRAALRFEIRALDLDPVNGEVLGRLPQLGDQIARNLTRMGFQVTSDIVPGRIPVTAELRLQRVNRGGGTRASDVGGAWVEYRWEGVAAIGGEPAGSVLVAEFDGAESHPEAATARLRARRQGELGLSRGLDRALKAFLDDLDVLNVQLSPQPDTRLEAPFQE